jgi:hypothetical protein
MRFNEQKALKFSTRLFEAKRKKVGIFRQNLQDPGDILPRNIKRKRKDFPQKYSNYIFPLCPMTPRVVSDVLFKRARTLHEKTPEAFKPKHVAKELSIELCQKITKNRLGHGFWEDMGRRWYENSVKLVEDYDGETTNLFKDTTDAIVVAGRLSKNNKGIFRGYADKTANLYLGYIHRFVHPFDNPYELKRPVDVHDIRMAVAQGILEIDDDEKVHHSPAQIYLMEEWRKFFIQHPEFDPTEHKLYSWFVGAYACNKYKPNKCFRYCPFDRCTESINIAIYDSSGEVLPTDEKQFNPQVSMDKWEMCYQ